MSSKTRLIYLLTFALSLVAFNTQANCFRLYSNTGLTLVGNPSGGDHSDVGCIDNDLLLGVNVKSGERIDKVVFQYETRDVSLNLLPDAGSGGSTHSFNVYPHHIKRVDVYTGKGGKRTTRVLGLRFTLSNGTVHGPYGSTSREHHIFEVKKDTNRIVGMFGRAGQEVDAIGFYGARR